MALFNKPAGKLSPSEIRDKFISSNKALQKEQWEYVMNRAMLAGEQWIRYDTFKNNVAAIPREPDRLRCTFNRLWPASRHLMSKLLSRPLVFEVAPSEADDASIRGSHVAEAILEHIHKYQNWEDIRENVAWATWLGGTSVIALDWDQSYGTRVGQREDGSDIGTGEVCATPLSILEFAVEPGTNNAEKSCWWIRAQALPPSEVQKAYDLKEKPAADAGAAQGYMGRTLTVEDIGRPHPDLTLVLTYYERPSKSRPEGVVATVVGDKFIDGPHPWPFPFKDRLNMVVIRETKMNSRAVGKTVFTAAVPVQVAYNQAWSNILEHLRNAGNARLMIPEASLDGVEDMTDLPGELLLYNNAAGKPEWLSPPQLASWVLENPREMAQQMDDILGLHDVSRGVAPSNVESGVGLSVLVEQDTTPLGALTRELAYGFERFACMVLETYAANVKDTRKARLQQRGQSPEIVEWNGKSLAGQTVASVPMDAVMPRSRTALMAFAKELWDRKIIQDPQMFTRIADLPDQDNLLDGIDSDAAKSQRENRDMAVGRIRVPDEFDQHETHIKKHNDFRKTLRYESLPEKWRKYVDDHILGHDTLAKEEAGKSLAEFNVNPALAAAAGKEQAPPIPQQLALQGGELPPSGVPLPPGAELPPGVPSGREGTPSLPGMEQISPGPEGPQIS